MANFSILEQARELDREKVIETAKTNWAFLTVSGIFLLALYIRYLPEQGMAYLQALDPYMIFRLSQHLALEGNFPAIDFMRYFPYSQPTHLIQQGNIIFPAVLYWLGPFLFFNSFLEWAQFYPAFMGALSVFVMYFFAKENFDRITGVSAAFFLATIAGAMHRTSAGFFEKEPIGTFFMMLSLYFFTRAWKRKDHLAGIASGIFLGFFTISWGGSKMLWLLYPLVTGLMLWINEDTRKLVIAYTPTVLIAGAIGVALNPARFWVTDSLFLLNLGLLGLLWSRYLVEELEVVSKDYLQYYIPSVSILGLVALVLSPLYSDFITSKWMSVLNKALQSGGGSDIVGGTVAENTPAGLGQLSSQLGSIGAAQAHTFLSQPLSSALRPFSTVMALLANINGVWPLAFVGTIFMATGVLTMVLRKNGTLGESISDNTYYKLAAIVTFIWALVFAVLFQDPNNPVLLIIGPSILLIGGGLGLLYSLKEMGERTIEFRWYHLLPLLWIITNLLGAVTKSRLVFLAAFPAALAAGYGFSIVIKKLRAFSEESMFYLAITGAVLVFDIVLIVVALSMGAQLLFTILGIVAINGLIMAYSPDERLEELRSKISSRHLRIGVISFIVILTLGINAASGFTAANQLGGSPNNLWMDNLEYMEQETPEGSVILSWWDYGYWFESIGKRAAVADGGNAGYYSSDRKINYPLADFLTSDSFENHTDFLEKHSVDYIVLDNSMIGKYSAVSQISNRDNSQFDSMLTLSTSRDIRNSLSSAENRTIVQFSSRGITGYAPIKLTNETPPSVEFESAPTVELQGQRSPVGCLLTDSGVREFDVDNPARLGGMGEICVAVDPYYSLERSLYSIQNPQMPPQQARLVLVPKSISDSVLVRLYLMDGYGIEGVEKVPEGSNTYVKMWKTNLEE